MEKEDFGLFQIEINVNGNDAFTESPELEVARILEDLAKNIRANGLIDCKSVLKDYNGNTVGKVR